jgi:DNA-binding transcriptional regulator YbjK
LSDTRSTTRRGDRRRSQILDAAVGCLIDDGWVGLTHRRVGQRAGANAALVQYYFKNLAGLREEVARVAGDQLTKPLTALARATETVGELVHACASGLHKAASQPDTVRLLVQVLVGTAYYPEVAAIVRAELAASKKTFAEHLGALDPARDQGECAAATALFFAAADGIMLHVLATPDEPLARRQDQLETLLSAVLASTSAGPSHR